MVVADQVMLDLAVATADRTAVFKTSWPTAPCSALDYWATAETKRAGFAARLQLLPIAERPVACSRLAGHDLNSFAAKLAAAMRPLRPSLMASSP